MDNPSLGVVSKQELYVRSEGKRSAGRRRPFIEPAFRIKMNGREHGRNRENRSLRRMKKRRTGRRSNPVESIAQKPLSLRLLRLGLDHAHGLGDFGTQAAVTGCDADG
jgi:hypothetical protein